MNSNEVWVENVIGKIREKIAWVSRKNAEKIPYTTDETGSYDDRGDLSRQ